MKAIPAKTITKPLVSTLHDAVFKDDLKKVTQLIKQGADWREANPHYKTQSFGKNLYSLKMNALEVAVVGHHLQIVSLILKQPMQGKDYVLLQKAFNLACNFNFINMLKAFHKHHALLVKNEFINALKENEVSKLKPSVARLINLPNREGDTPLHTATRSYNRDVIIVVYKQEAPYGGSSQLIHAGSNIDLRSSSISINCLVA